MFITISYRLLFTLICAWGFLLPLQAQPQPLDEAYFPFLLKDSTRIFSLSETISKSVEASYVMTSKINGNHKKHFNAIKENASEEVADIVKYTALLDEVVDPFLQNTLRRLQASNPEAKNCRLIVTRSYIDNAFATGDGTIFINAGLVRTLKNEDQLAFVVAHELAHNVLNHVQKNLSNYLGSLYNKDLQAEYNKIIKNGYNKNKRIKALLMKVSVNNLYHQRHQESAADSMAFHMIKSAGFNPAEAYNALKTFDHSGSLGHDIFERQASFFACKENWQSNQNTEGSTSIFNVKKEVDNSDSLKTHPDCKIRMAAIRKLLIGIGQDTMQSLAANPDDTFQKVNRAAGYESIQAMFDYEYFDKSLYNSLCQLQSEPQSKYLRSVAILSLLQLKSYLQRHRYSEAVSNISDYNPQELNKFLQFLNALNLSDFKALKESFDKLYPGTASKDEFSLMATFAGAHLTGYSPGANSLAAEYKRMYPSGRFTTLLQQLNYIKTKKK